MTMVCLFGHHRYNNFLTPNLMYKEVILNSLIFIYYLKEEWYLGLGIINGLLTVTWSQKYKKPNKLTAPLSNITNSDWHTVRLNVTKSDITLELDDWISDPTHHNVESFNLNNNIIYLGNKNIYKHYVCMYIM